MTEHNDEGLYEAIRDGWLAWLDTHTTELIDALGTAMATAVSGALPEAGYVVDAVERGVRGAMPDAHYVLDAIAQGVRAR